MAKSHLKLVAPTTVNRTVAMPRRRPNAELRTREYLTDAEVERLTEAAKGNRHGHRDATMILVAYRHGLRAVELVGPSLGSDRLRHGHPARPPGQAGHAEHPPDPGRRTARPAPTAARAGAQVAVCVHVGARRALHHGGLCADGGACWRRGEASASRPTRTCCGTPAASRWPTRATTRGRCRPIWATRISSTRCATPSCRPIGSRISGDNAFSGPNRLAEGRLRAGQERAAVHQNAG